MNLTDHSESILNEIDLKFQAINQKTDVQLEGLLWSKPITYWDYIQTDALLNLQIQRTTLPDEMVFIMYHQVNELLFKMILWEIDQVSNNNDLTPEFFTERLMRISRYFDMLTSSFKIMQDGMEPEQYLKFRNTLKGFSSKTLAIRLKELEKAGILKRQSYNEIPPRVEYNLTDKGQELVESVISLLQWMQKWSNTTITSLSNAK